MPVPQYMVECAAPMYREEGIFSCCFFFVVAGALLLSIVHIALPSVWTPIGVVMPPIFGGGMN